MLELHVVTKGETENKAVLKPGTVVEYCGHLPGGNVSIKIEGKDDVANPLCFEELR